MTTPAFEPESLEELLALLLRDALQTPDVDARKLAERGIRSVHVKTLRELAIRRLVEMIESYRRAKDRRVEQQSVRSAETEFPTFRSVASDATEEVTAENFLNLRDPRLSGNTRERARFRKTMGDRFEDWYALAERFLREAGDAKTLQWFEDDWHPDGPMGAAQQRRFAAMGEHINEMARAIRLEVTEELLSTMFSIGDGERVTWGLATVEQHAARVQMLTGQAVGVTETASRHAAAIQMLKEGGATCLAELKIRQAAARTPSKVKLPEQLPAG